MQTATALIYWVIVALWLAVLATVARAYWRNPHAFGVTRLLLIVVGVDTSRNIVENLYFGFYFGSQYGLFERSIANVLGSPSLLIVPKIVNVLAACVVLSLLLFRWLPLALKERLIAEQTVQAKTRQLVEEADERRRIIDTALDAFMQIDQRGTVRQWSLQAEKMFGVAPGAAIGSLLEDVIGLDVGYKTALESIAHDEDGSGIRIQADAKGQDAVINVELSISTFKRQDEDLFNIFARDLTDKIASESQLRQSQKMEAVGQLTGGVAHDFNNILTVITGTIDILAEEVAERPNLVAITKMITEAADRGAGLTRGLLAFARKQPLQPSNLDVNILVTEAERLLRPTLGERVRIKTILSAHPWFAFVDGAQLSSAILNLALNARDAMPDGGTLTIETRNASLDDEYAAVNGKEVYAGDYVQLSISDSGTGIAPDIIDSIFEPFFTTKQAGEGTGLGLSMVYGFVKQSRGHIKVYSEVGVGTTFKLYLPRTQAALDVKHDRLEPARGGDEVVLVVEDDALVRNYVINQVSALGYRTLVAANAEEALAILKTDDVHLLFTDVIMPGPMNGPDLVRRARAMRPDIKVLYTSGYTENAIVHNGRLDAGVLLLQKPYRKSELAKMLRAALDDAETVGS